MEEKMIFLGTGAAEAIPAHFCNCNYCTYARLNKGKDIRSRSSFRINNKVHIDFGPDIFYQCVNNSISLYDLENILVTHTHPDHFMLPEFVVRDYAINRLNKPLNIYVSRDSFQWINDTFDKYLTNDLKYEEFKYFKNEVIKIIPFSFKEELIVNTMKVIPLKGNHNGQGYFEYAANYLINLENNKKMYYAVDTGFFLEETIEYLKNMELDYLIMECTFGGTSLGDKPKGHLDFYSFNDMLNELFKNKTITKETKIYATHINHKHNWTHNVFQHKFDEISDYDVLIAYDGLKI